MDGGLRLDTEWLKTLEADELREIARYAEAIQRDPFARVPMPRAIERKLYNWRLVRDYVATQQAG